MSKARVLLAEDELALAHIVRESLEERNFDVVICNNGEAAIKEYERRRPDILVLDIMMPLMDGFAVADSIRKADKQTPIIFLTARSQPKDVVAGFEAGANDYLKKPFSVEELIVRIQVLLSKDRLLSPLSTAPVEVFLISSLTFNSQKNFIVQGVQVIALTSRESEILKLLCLHKQEVLKREVLLKKLWGNDNFFNARSLDVFITKLRKHLAIDPEVQIINVRGVGYKLVY
ncbi:MAG: response regulator transcription factor [Sphingobacteriaceae bacterium]|nr:response regulator transcription factor [Sphingobacteriaceae bacterium]